MKSYSLFACLLVCLLFSACFDDDNVSQLHAMASEKANKLYGHLREKHFDSTISFFSEEFLATTPADSVLAAFSKTNQDWGNIKSTELLRTGYDVDAHIFTKSDRTLTQTYRVFYSSGFTTHEEIVFLVDETGTSVEKINAYTLDAY